MQMSLTICSILQEVLPGAWNDNRDIFQMKIIVTILGRVDNLHLKKMFYDFPWLFGETKKSSLVFADHFIFQVVPDFPGWWEPWLDY